MGGRLEPCGDDVSGGDLPPRPDEQVLAEARVAVPGRTKRRRRIGAARRVGENATGSDSPPLQRRCPLERRRLREGHATILPSRPVDQAAHRTPLGSRGRSRIVSSRAGRRRREIRAPGASGGVCRNRHDERGHGGRNERREAEPDRCCRSRRGHKRTVGTTRRRSLPSWGEQRSLGSVILATPAHSDGSRRSPGWCDLHVAAASSPSASVGSTASAR